MRATRPCSLIGPPRRGHGPLLRESRARAIGVVGARHARDQAADLSRRLRHAGRLLHGHAPLVRPLGFPDVRAFRRAFLAWTGEGPDAWRRRQPGQG